MSQSWFANNKWSIKHRENSHCDIIRPTFERIVAGQIYAFGMPISAYPFKELGAYPRKRSARDGAHPARHARSPPGTHTTVKAEAPFHLTTCFLDCGRELVQTRQEQEHATHRACRYEAYWVTVLPVSGMKTTAFQELIINHFQLGPVGKNMQLNYLFQANNNNYYYNY